MANRMIEVSATAWAWFSWPWSRTPALCKGCGVRLTGEPVKLTGYSATRRHFGDRCIPCYMRWCHAQDMEIYKAAQKALEDAVRHATEVR